MTSPDPIDYSAYETPEPSQSLTNDILERVGREGSAAPSRLVPRAAVAAAIVVAAAAAALIVWKMQAGEDGSATSVAADEPQIERDPAPLPLLPTPEPERPRRISADERTKVLAAINERQQQRAGSGQAELVLSRAEIQAAMAELRPLIEECHEMALERTPDLFGTLKVRMVLVGEPGVATVVAEAEADPGDGLDRDAEFLVCITETLLSVELAPPAVAGTRSLTYPFVFRAPSDAAGPTHRVPPGTAAAGPSADALTKSARVEAENGEWGKALALVKQALALEPENQDALMVGALAACNVQNADLAQEYTEGLSSPTRRGMARQSCLQQGVELP